MAQPRQRNLTLDLILIMVAVTTVTVGVSIWILYRKAFEHIRTDLAASMAHQAQLMETVARSDAADLGHPHPEGPTGATLS